MVNQVTKQFLLGGSEMAINRVFYYNDSCIVGTTFSSKGQFFVYNHLQDSVNYYNVHPQKGLFLLIEKVPPISVEKVPLFCHNNYSI